MTVTCPGRQHPFEFMYYTMTCNLMEAGWYAAIHFRLSRGVLPGSLEAGQQHFQRCQQWLYSLGNAVISPAIPFRDTHVIQPDGTVSPGSASAMSDLSIIWMDLLQDALAVVRSCPFFEINGTPEVSEMVEMSGRDDEQASDKPN